MAGFAFASPPNSAARKWAAIFSRAKAVQQTPPRKAGLDGDNRQDSGKAENSIALFFRPPYIGIMPDISAAYEIAKLAIAKDMRCGDALPGSSNTVYESQPTLRQILVALDALGVRLPPNKAD